MHFRLSAHFNYSAVKGKMITMKRFLALVMALALLILAACADEFAPGSSLPSPAPNTPPPAFMLDDILYYSTGREVFIEVDESDYLGRTISISLSELPSENGQANLVFDGAPYIKYQEGYAILMDTDLDGTDEWILYEARGSSGVSSSESDNTIREINATTELIGNPDRVIVMVNEVETVYEADSAEFNSILTILNNRMPDGFDEAASAFMWLNEDENDIDWSFMAQDFDYIRLAYNNKQTVKINCMADNYDDYAPEASFCDITFPLTESDLSGSTDMCILGMGKFLGILDNSEGTMSKLRSLASEPQSSTEAAEQQSPIEKANPSQISDDEPEIQPNPNDDPYAGFFPLRLTEKHIGWKTPKILNITAKS